MNKSKCPICGSMHTIKYGSHKGIQTYKCTDCGYRFRNVKKKRIESMALRHGINGIGCGGAHDASHSGGGDMHSRGKCRRLGGDNA